MGEGEWEKESGRRRVAEGEWEKESGRNRGRVVQGVFEKESRRGRNGKRGGWRWGVWREGEEKGEKERV